MRAIIIKSILLALITSMASAQPALAYIDPSVGGQLFQILATGFALVSGVALLFSRQIRVGFARVRRLLRDRFGTDADDDETQD